VAVRGLERDGVVVARVPPSMVTVVTRRKSVRPSRSSSRTAAPMVRASATTSGGCASGMPNFRMMICVSTPGSSMRPSTSLTVPAGPRVALGHRVIDTTTMSPGAADEAWPFGIWISVTRRRSNGTT
jgi:hypothetical protein